LHLTVLERELLEQIVFYPALKILLFLTDTRENGIKNRDLGEKSQKIINGEINNILIKNESYQDVYDEVEKERKTIAEKIYFYLIHEEFLPNIYCDQNEIYLIPIISVVKKALGKIVKNCKFLTSISSIKSKESIQFFDDIIFHIFRYFLESIRTTNNGRAIVLNESPSDLFHKLLSYISSNADYIDYLCKLEKEKLKTFIKFLENIKNGRYDKHLHVYREKGEEYFLIPKNKVCIDIRLLVDTDSPTKFSNFLICPYCKIGIKGEKKPQKCPQCKRNIEKTYEMVEIPKTLIGENIDMGRILEAIALLKIRYMEKEKYSLISHNIVDQNTCKEFDIVSIKIEVHEGDNYITRLFIPEIDIYECKIKCEKKDVEKLKEKIEMFSHSFSCPSLKGFILCLESSIDRNKIDNIEIIKI